MNSTTTKSLALVNKEISNELADPHIVKALLATTFKDFTPELMRQAIFEGVIRGFTFKDFLQKDVFAIKYGGGYNLVTSIDFARKIGMRSGVVGKSAPTFEMDGKQILSCSVTVKRRVGQDIGEYTATVYFDEFSTGKNLWNSKPRTMLAKVAEMHALRMACPELAKAYTEEEFDKVREEGGDFDRSEISDDAQVTTTGDDHSTTEREIPTDPLEQKRTIEAMLLRRDATLNIKDADAVHSAVEGLTSLVMVEANYSEIIRSLSK